MNADVQTFLMAIAIVMETNLTLWACVAVTAKRMRMPMAFVMTKTIVLVHSMRAASATALVPSTNADVLTSLKAIVIVMEISSMSLAYVAVNVKQM